MVYRRRTYSSKRTFKRKRIFRRKRKMIRKRSKYSQQLKVECNLSMDMINANNWNTGPEGTRNKIDWTVANPPVGLDDYNATLAKTKEW